MTIWTPDLSRFSGPKYRAIADAIAADVAEGRLPAGTRLPTHRDLAYALDVTVGTITRAYKEAERRGLLAGEVGRGTYVRGVQRGQSFMEYHQTSDADGDIDLALNFPGESGRDEALRQTLEEVAKSNRLIELVRYQDEAGILEHRVAGARWLSEFGLSSDPNRIVVTSGGQNGMMACFLSLCKPGDTVLTEAFTYPGMHSLADRLGLKLHGLACDQDGVLPEALEAALKSRIGTVAYLMPTLQNPTNVVMPQTRREVLAEIIRKYDAQLVEDDVYGPHVSDRPPALAALLPDHGFYIASASKTMAPGLRVGFVHAPNRWVARIAQSIRVCSWMAAPLNAEITARWIQDGTLKRFISQHRMDASKRVRIVRDIFNGKALMLHDESYHAWIELPAPWQADAFVNAARARGVLLLGSPTFATTRLTETEAVRLSIGRPRTHERLEKGLNILRDLMDEGPSADVGVV